MKKICLYSLLMMLIGLMITACGKQKIEEEEPYPIEQPTANFDNSVFKQLTKEEALSLYDMEGTQIVFACNGDSVNCQKVYKAVVQVQKEFDYTTNYLYIFGRFAKEFKDFISKLDFYIEVNNSVSGEFSKLLGGTNTYYPAIIIIKDGKQVNGLIGNDISYENLKNLVSKYIQ